MILTQDSSDALFQIRAYQPGQITVNDQIYRGSLIVSPQHIIPDWAPQSLQELKPQDWLPILHLNPEVILLGTGDRFKMPPPLLLEPAHAQKISVESMNTGAACRTYMALAAEGRRVVAALLIS